MALNRDAESHLLTFPSIATFAFAVCAFADEL